MPFYLIAFSLWGLIKFAIFGLVIGALAKLVMPGKLPRRDLDHDVNWYRRFADRDLVSAVCWPL